MHDVVNPENGSLVGTALAEPLLLALDGFEEETCLVRRAIGGDYDAFGDLYLRYLDAIFRYIYYRVADGQDAEDLTGQVFLKAWEALPGYRQTSYPFSSWLYRIAHNLVIDYRRRRPQASNSASKDETQAFPEGVTESTLDLVIRSEQTSALAAAIARLPEDQQQVILLRFVEGLKHAEVARLLNKSEGACRVLQYQALLALNRRLSDSQERP